MSNDCETANREADERLEAILARHAELNAAYEVGDCNKLDELVMLGLVDHLTIMHRRIYPVAS